MATFLISYPSLSQLCCSDKLPVQQSIMGIDGHCCNQVSFMQMLLQEPTSSTLQQLLMRIEEERRKPTDVIDVGRVPPPLPLPLPPLEHESCITQVSESASDDRNGLVAPVLNGGAAVGGLAKVLEETRKRKRRRAPRKAERTTESQRMSHIAVERNRRRLMNEHLAALRSLMPSSYVQRGDQASIVGGAIDYVKDLEKHLQGLQAEKQRTRDDATGSRDHRPFECFFVAPQYGGAPPRSSTTLSRSCQLALTKPMKAENDVDCGGGVDVEATVVQTHVNLRVFVPHRHGQLLLRAVAALERLRLAVLHLNVTSFQDSVLYSLNLKIEEGCKLSTADVIATAVHHMFAYVS